MILYIENTKEFTHKKKYFCCSVIKSCLTICNPRNYSILGFLSFTISQSLFKLMSIESSNQLILCRPFTSCPQSIPASGSFPMSRLFTSGSSRYWSFSFSISPSSEYSGLIPFRIDWLDLLAVQGTLKSLFQHHSSKAPIH